MGARTVIRVATLVALALVVGQMPAYAQHGLTGSLGADLSALDFSNKLPTLSEAYAVNRALSDQYLQLNFRGPLYHPRVGTYSVLGKLAGSYYKVDSTTGDAAEYTNPRLTSAGIQLGLFPAHRFPVRLYYLKSTVIALNFESENRSRDDQSSPELAAVRRYDAENESAGIDVRYILNQTSELGGEVRQAKMKSLRQYDFSEQRDIFAEFRTVIPDPTLQVARIILENKVPEGDVDLVIDGQIVTTLQPEERFEFQIEAGPHDVEFLPERFNPFRETVIVDGDMQWLVVFNAPPGRTDIVRTEDAATIELTTGREQRLENVARLDYSDSFESVVGSDIQLMSLDNSARFDWSRRTKLHSQTTWSKNVSEIANISSQEITALRQQTKLRYATLDGTQAGVEHVLDHSNSIIGPTDRTTTQNRLRLEAGRPLGPYEHRMMVRTTLTRLGDDTDYESNENRFELLNMFEIDTWGIRWKPRSSLLQTSTTRKNPDDSFDEFEVREVIEGEHPEVWRLGTLRGKLEYGWRRRAEERLTNKTTSVEWELGLTRELGHRYRLEALAVSDRESYDSSAEADGGDVPIVRAPRKQKVYRLGLRGNPWDAMTFDLGYFTTSQEMSSLREVRAQVTLRIPWLDVPVTSFYSKQRRELEGRQDQTTTRFETKMFFTLRRLRLQLEHAYISEELFSEDYSLNNFRAEIVRSFNVF